MKGMVDNEENWYLDIWSGRVNSEIRFCNLMFVRCNTRWHQLQYTHLIFTKAPHKQD